MISAVPVPKSFLGCPASTFSMVRAVNTALPPRKASPTDTHGRPPVRIGPMGVFSTPQQGGVDVTDASTLNDDTLFDGVSQVSRG